MIDTCPVCSGRERSDVVSLPSMPVLINAQVRPAEAPDVPCGDIDLVVCHGCAHLYNRSFDPRLLDYDAAYENTLHFSPAFRSFADSLADRLVAEYGLAGGEIAELGSGPGHFLAMLCDRGVAHAHGFDPSYDPERMGSPEHPAVSISTEPFPDDGSVDVAFAFSQHVLEHLTDPVAALRSLRGATDRSGGVVYSEVPNAQLMIDECAIWDVIYEHLSYFGPTSFDRVHRRAGLEIERSGVDFGDQFLWGTSHIAGADDDTDVGGDVVENDVRAALDFGHTALARIDEARDQLARWAQDGPVVLWGSGSKGATYLNLVCNVTPVAGVIDVNPRKVGFGVPGTALEISDPGLVETLSPATVVVANPMYRDEIAAEVTARGGSAQIEVLWG